MRKKVLICILVMMAAMAALVARAAAAEEAVRLEDEHMLVEVSPANGAIVRVEDKSHGVTFEPDRSAIESFRLVLLREDKSTVTVTGRDQKLSGSASEHGALHLRWDGPLKDTEGTEHDIAVRMRIGVDSGAARFTLELDNKSNCRIREAWYPFVGGLQNVGPDASGWAPSTNPWQKPLQAPFGANSWHYPGHLNMSFVCVQSRAAGKSVYFSSQDEIARYKVYHLMGVGDAGKEDVCACIQHLPLTRPGGRFSGSPVVVRVVDGDWRAAGQVYRDWFGTAFGIASPDRDWIRRQSFFLMTMFMLPEGTINYTFRDIPRWARAAKEHGVNAVQISGWQVGGHDNGYPYYVPDPRLGTWEELEEGIRACHEMGLKVFFFVNYQPMMLESELYKNELHKYREWNPEGGLTWQAGWGMGTLWARMGNPKLMTWADAAFPQFRRIIVDQFEKLAKIGADGVHVDKVYPSAINYNPDTPMEPDTATWEGTILLSREVMAACRKHNPNWAMSFECNWDRLLEFGGCTWWVGNQLVTRSVFPENAETLAIVNAYDYLGVNNAVRGGHHVMIAPMSFARGMDWKPFEGLNAYIRDVKRVQDELQDTVFLGEVMGREGIVTGALEQGVDLNVFRNRATGLRVCVLTNSSLHPREQMLAAFEGPSSGWARVHSPSQKSYELRLPSAIEIPAERIVFVEEMEGEGRASARPVSKPAEAAPETTSIPNGNFETGGFEGWTADDNWVVAGDSRGYYSGWQGNSWAWSGGSGEQAVGKLTSRPFRLDRDGVSLLISGWNSIAGTGNPRRWNYVTLKSQDGKEIDRVYAPNTTAFVPAFLDGSGHVGEMVYVEAVDDADQATFSMLCIDDVRTADLPAAYAEPVPELADYDASRSAKLENEHILMEVDRANGSITRLRDKSAGLDLILEPRLAGSWKFALPIPGKEPWQTIEANWIIGREQKLSSVEVEDDLIRLRWDGPLSNYLGERYDVSVTVTAQLADGGLSLGMSVENRTPYQVGETYFPVMGGIQGLGRLRGHLKTTEFVRPSANDGFSAADIFRTFLGMSAFGDQGPEQFYAYPAAQPQPWAALHSEKLGRSVYIGAHDPRDRSLVVRLELVPSNSGTVREDGNWPRPEDLDGLPVGVELSFVDCAGGKPAEDYEAAPVFVRFHDGGWSESKNIYEQWRSSR